MPIAIVDRLGEKRCENQCSFSRSRTQHPETVRMLTMTLPERKVIDDSNHDLAQRDEFQRSGLRRIQEVEYLIGTVVAS